LAAFFVGPPAGYPRGWGAMGLGSELGLSRAGWLWLWGIRLGSGSRGGDSGGAPAWDQGRLLPLTVTIARPKSETPEG